MLLIGTEEVQRNLKGLNAKIEKTSWEYLTPLYRYDMVIVDNSSVNSKTVRIAVRAREEFHEFVTRGGILVCLCCRAKNYGGYKSYGWLPRPPSFKVEVIAGEAHSLKIKRSSLERFFDQQKNNINVECYFGNVEIIPNVEVIATTGLEKVVAFSMKLGKGEVIYLPQFKDKELFLREWLRFWISGKPDWLEKYQYKEKGKLLAKLKTINTLEKLLYGNDRDLCKAVAEAFRILGFEVEISSKGTEPDIYIRYGHFTGIVEVKGLKTHADRDDMRALLDYYDAKMEEQPELKGIFVVNHYYRIEPKKKEKPYTDGAMELAQRKGFCLLTAADMYFAMEKALNDPSLREDMRKNIINGVGLIKLTSNNEDDN
ncbi:hypothetical protein J7L18_02085 [Candidatus Bathyarchaeota archaeon]|nr:hypothetical protein [Candidatus Bathyarchaeota archaeon]